MTWLCSAFLALSLVVRPLSMDAMAAFVVQSPLCALLGLTA